MERLRNTVMNYAWGSRTALAELFGRTSPAAGPEAEMWMGAHPSAPSLVVADPQRSLADRIAAAPAAELGDSVARRFDGHLPFLLKILAVDSPLSLQVHPTLEQALDGFAREERAGIARSSPSRNYKDANHKPEILCALGPFEALCGFRSADETARLLEMLGAACLRPVARTLREHPGPEGLRAAFEQVMTLEPEARPAFVGKVVAACRRALERPGPYRAELGWAVELSARYPHDVGVVSSLLLNLVHLEAGQAMFLPAGRLHSYLKGVGIELMAASDNVLRGGLTPKHVDIAELLRVLDFSDGPAEPVAVREVCAHEREYAAPVADFRLSVIELRGGDTCTPRRRGPEILLCVGGRAEAAVDGSDPFELERGESAYVPASDPGYRLAGRATVVRATAGDLAAGDVEPGPSRRRA